MNASEILQINTEPFVDLLPKSLELTSDFLDLDLLTLPEGLFQKSFFEDKTSILDELHPLIVRPIENGRFCIVDGCKKFVKRLSGRKTPVSCKIIQTSMNELTAGLLRIVLNRHWRHNHEKYLVIKWLSEKSFQNSNVIIQNLGYTHKEKESLTKLIFVNDDLRRMVFTDELDISLIEYMNVLSPSDRVGFVRTFKDIKLSHQTKREFLEWLPEIAYNEKCSVVDILNRDGIVDILSNEALNIPQKVKQLRNLLYREKFPLLSKVEEQWRKKTLSLNPDSSCLSFIPNAFFEKDQIQLKISITNSQNAKSLFMELANISHEDWKYLIHPK